jgi:hypothetical protein
MIIIDQKLVDAKYEFEQAQEELDELNLQKLIM